MDADTEKTAKPRRRWFRFSLKTLLIVVTVLSVPLGWIGWRLQQVRREQTTIAWIVEIGGRVYFRSGFQSDDRSWWEESTDKWLGERVWRASLHNKQVSDLSPLAELKRIGDLFLAGTQVSDLSPLAELKNLTFLDLDNTQVSDLSPLAELRRLGELHLLNTQVSDLSPLAENWLSDLPPVKSNMTLVLSNTQVIDLSPLASLKYLSF